MLSANHVFVPLPIAHQKITTNTHKEHARL